jgi:hypothetical protein
VKDMRDLDFEVVVANVINKCEKHGYTPETRERLLCRVVESRMV